MGNGGLEPGLRGSIAATASGAALSYDIASVLDPIEKGSWPDELVFAEERLPRPEELPKQKISGTGRLHVISSLAMFVQYFDSIENLAAQRQADELVRFARQVRNFAAHGGEIRGIDPRATRLRWASVEWTAADNGTPVLAGDVTGKPGLSRGDLILLMRDVDAVL